MDNYTSNNGAIINKEEYYPQDSGKPVKETAGSFSSFFKEKRKELYKEEKNSHTVHAPVKIYPNDPCPCGSGKKYKKCHGRNSAE